MPLAKKSMQRSHRPDVVQQRSRLLGHRDSTRDGWIKEFIKRK
jgi:hypothetical protein